MAAIQKITPCLWFDTQAEEAVIYYCTIFANSRILQMLRFSSADHEIHQERAGSVMLVEFELEGQRFTAVNGGPYFTFSEAVSFEVACENQEEVDHYWNSLTKEGEEGPCGWLKDKYGLSWQIVPNVLREMLADPDQEKVLNVTNAFLKMKKLDIAALEEAFSAKSS